ncbi:MAG: T9SS type A sorting domain-containing protein, partial [Flavobacteriales bacterium]|nr:T9SS type A sorting domain-containing protein [Flavobacteriales bacterium]
DEAMEWFLERANGGDVVVIRTSGSDGYNDYMFSGLGVTLNSVETIVFNSAEAANDPYVIERLNGAEAIWMAGGNQATYVNFWKDTPVQDAINNLVNVKQGVLGGTSAGMAVMGQAYFPALGGSVNSETALNNPFTPGMLFGYDDFIQAPFMENVITETHLNDPDRIRYGRITGFLARIGHDYGFRPLGMASNEYCAIVIGSDGIARAYGDFPEFDDDFVYFLQANCVTPRTPEILEADQPITWIREGEAVKVYQVPATPSGENFFNVNTWNEGEGGAWENWTVEDGALVRETDATAPECVLSVNSQDKAVDALIFPNPAKDHIRVRSDLERWDYRIFDVSGRLLLSGQNVHGEGAIPVNALSPGLYKLSIQSGNAYFSGTFVKYD